MSGMPVCAWAMEPKLPTAPSPITAVQDKEPQLKLNFQVIAGDEVTVIRCRGRIVYCYEASALAAKVAEVAPDKGHLVLDLGAVDSIDNTGLGQLLNCLHISESRGCALRLAAPSRRVMEVLELTHLNSVFEIHATVEEAMLAQGTQVA